MYVLHNYNNIERIYMWQTGILYEVQSDIKFALSAISH